MTDNKSKNTGKRVKPRKAGAVELAEEDLDSISGGPALDLFIKIGHPEDPSADPRLGLDRVSPPLKKA